MKYRVGCIQDEKILLVDLTDIYPRDLNKLLLDDLCKIAECTKSENMFIAINLANLSARQIARNLLVYGFEKSSKEECEKFTSNKNILMMKMEINQEDDFVDLY